MPMLNLELATAPSAPLARTLAATLRTLTAERLGKRPELTAVSLRFVDPAHWFVDGQSLTELGRPAALLVLRITEGSNAPEAIAAYLAAVHEALRAQLPDLHPVSYTVVDGVPASAWGWGGRTQASRRGSSA